MYWKNCDNRLLLPPTQAFSIYKACRLTFVQNNHECSTMGIEFSISLNKRIDFSIKILGSVRFFQVILTSPCYTLFLTKWPVSHVRIQLSTHSNSIPCSKWADFWTRHVFLWVFIKFLKIFEKNSKLADFWPKNLVFSILIFLRKMYLVCGKCSYHSQIEYTCTQRYPLQYFANRILIFWVQTEKIRVLWT